MVRRPRLDPATAAALDRIAMRLTLQKGRLVSEKDALRLVVEAADTVGTVVPAERRMG